MLLVAVVVILLNIAICEKSSFNGREDGVSVTAIGAGFRFDGAE
mgnify:CR=1 FL=1